MTRYQSLALSMVACALAVLSAYGFVDYVVKATVARKFRQLDAEVAMLRAQRDEALGLAKKIMTEREGDLQTLRQTLFQSLKEVAGQRDEALHAAEILEVLLRQERRQCARETDL